MDSNTIWGNVKSFFTEIGDMAYFAGRFFIEVFKPPFEFRELLRQCYNMGNRSLLLVSVTGFILGLVFTLQSRPTLMEFRTESFLRIDTFSEAYLLRNNQKMGKRELSSVNSQQVLDSIITATNRA